MRPETIATHSVNAHAGAHSSQEIPMAKKAAAKKAPAKKAAAVKKPAKKAAKKR